MARPRQFVSMVQCRFAFLLPLFVYGCLTGYCGGSNTTGTECTQGNNVCTLPKDRSLRFFILGDWGGQERYPYVTKIQDETARSVFNASTVLRPQFYLSTGDNFYERGVRSVRDHRFNRTFEEVYAYGKTEKMPWYMTAGNHDYYGNVQAQLDYAKANPRWVYPSLSYPIRYAFGQHRRSGGNLTTVDIFVIDTIVLCGGTLLGGYDSQTKTYVKASDRPQGPKNVTAANELFKWLDDQLSSSTANFLFVMGHYPVYSTGIHGNTECLRTRLPDMLMKYKVNAFISGHDHQLQHLTMIGPNGWTVNHLISGAAAKYDRRYKAPLQTSADSLNVVTSMYVFPNSRDSLSKGGYAYGEVRERFAVFEFYRSDGAFLYAFTSRRRN